MKKHHRCGVAPVTKRKFDLALANEMRDFGVSVWDIAKHFGVSVGCAFKATGGKRENLVTIEQFFENREAAQ